MKKKFLLLLLSLFTFSFAEIPNTKKEEISTKTSLSENEKKELIKEPVKKYKKKKKPLNNIEISGSATFRYDSRK